jgi:hypothetical protein
MRAAGRCSFCALGRAGAVLAATRTVAGRGVRPERPVQTAYDEDGCGDDDGADNNGIKHDIPQSCLRLLSARQVRNSDVENQCQVKKERNIL